MRVFDLFKPVLEIRGRDGTLHFRRWSLLSTSWFSLYLHRILAPDKDRHQHDHPWDITVLILWGGYWEKSGDQLKLCRPGTILKRVSGQFHKIEELLAPTWSLAFVGPRKHFWGYDTEEGFVDHKTYRKMKREGRWKTSNNR